MVEAKPDKKPATIVVPHGPLTSSTLRSPTNYGAPVDSARTASKPGTPNTPGTPSARGSAHAHRPSNSDVLKAAKEDGIIDDIDPEDKVARKEMERLTRAMYGHF